MIFTKRYKELIGDSEFDDDFCGTVSPDIKKKIVGIMKHFAEPVITHPDRYNQAITHKSDAFKDACYKFDDLMSSSFTRCIAFKRYSTFEGAIACQRIAYIFSIIELQYEELSVQEKAVFSSEMNTFLSEQDIAFRIIDGKMIKIDAQQFECDLKAKTLAQMQELKDAEPKFQSAYTELTTAVEALEKGDYQSAINNAGKSYESILKVILGADRGNADKLTKQYADSLLVFPDTMKADGFREKVMMSLPYVRNNSGADHGAGAKEVVITKPMAKLAVNLAAALDTYLIEEYMQDTASSN